MNHTPLSNILHEGIRPLAKATSKGYNWIGTEILNENPGSQAQLRIGTVEVVGEGELAEVLKGMAEDAQEIA